MLIHVYHDEVRPDHDPRDFDFIHGSHSKTVIRDVRERGRDIEGCIKQWFGFVKPNFEKVSPTTQKSDPTNANGSPRLLTLIRTFD
jgi:hypothetical protein